MGVFCLQKEAIAYPLACVKVKDVYEVLVTWQSNIYCVGKISIYPLSKSVVLLRKSFFFLTMPKFTSQILLLFSKVLHILENLLLKNFTGLKVVS